MSKGGIVFRVDGSRSLGLGHLVRSISLAEALQAELGESAPEAPIRFAVRDDEGAREALRECAESIDIVWLPRMGDWLNAFENVVRDVSPRVVVTDIDLRRDHKKYLSLLGPGSIHVSLHEHNYALLTGDIVVAPTVRPVEVAKGGTPGVTHFSGPEYILLSIDILRRRSKSSPPRPDPLYGVVALGGGDPAGLTRLVLEALRGLSRSDLVWSVVLGPASGYSLRALSDEFPGPFEFLSGAELGRNRFLDLLSTADVVMANGGTTLYEALCLRRPAFAIPQNEFESAVTDFLAISGACMGAGSFEPQGLSSELREFISDGEKRQRIASAGGGLIDGEGCSRVAKLIVARL